MNCIKWIKNQRVSISTYLNQYSRFAKHFLPKNGKMWILGGPAYLFRAPVLGCSEYLTKGRQSSSRSHSCDRQAYVPHWGAVKTPHLYCRSAVACVPPWEVVKHAWKRWCKLLVAFHRKPCYNHHNYYSISCLHDSLQPFYDMTCLSVDFSLRYLRFFVFCFIHIFIMADSYM
jgi:hypothetical protein